MFTDSHMVSLYTAENTKYAENCKNKVKNGNIAV